MKLEDIKQEFPPMPEDIRAMVEKEVQKQVNAPTRPDCRPVRKLGRTLLIAAAVLVVLTVAAVAVNQTGLYGALFGTQAVETPVNKNGTIVVDAHDAVLEDKYKGDITIRQPGYELVAVDEEDAERLLGPYLKVSNEVYTVEGHTVTILGYLEDEIGVYRVYFSIENPDGLEDIALEENNGYLRLSGADSSGFYIGASQSAYVDTKNSTETKMYVCDINLVTELDREFEVPQLKICGGLEEEKLQFFADELVPAKIVDNGNYFIQLSPMGMMITSYIRGDEHYHFGLESTRVSIKFRDGTEFVVKDEHNEILNSVYTMGGWTIENEVLHKNAFCFNRLIDPEEVVSVTITEIVPMSSTEEQEYTETIVFG